MIVVVSILAILWTISFIWFNWLIKDSRDSTRIVTLKNIDFWIKSFNSVTWFYPDPNKFKTVTYSWSSLWKQWEFWFWNFSQIQKISKMPVDVLTNNNFTYSLANNKFEYQLWTVIEWSAVSLKLSPEVHANWNVLATSYNIWDFNGLIVRTNTWWITYVLAMPTLIVNDLSDTNIVDILDEKRLTYNWFFNLAETYKNTIFNTKWGFDFDPSIYVIYAWTEDDLLYSENKRIELVQNLQQAYSWTILDWIDNLEDILNVDFSEDSVEVRELAHTIVENHLYYDLPVELTSWPNWVTYDITNSLIDNDTRSIAQDLANNIWFATKKWVNMFWGNVWLSYDEADWLADKDTRVVLPDSSGNLWFATNKWISKFDWTTWTTLDKTDWLIDNDVVSMIEDSSWNLWMATKKWISKFD